MARPNQAPPSRRRDRRELSRQERPDRTRRTYRPSTRPAWQSPMALVSGAAVLVALIVIAIAVIPGMLKGEELITPPSAYSADLTDGETLGSATAPVVMEIWSDFQCPYCGRLAKEQLGRFVADFVKTGKLRIEARDIDIVGGGTADSESLALAVGARCAAEQDLYWQFHDLVFWNPQPENRGLIDAAFIARIADATGVDRAKWDACIAREDVRPAVLQTTADARALGINSTPTLRINGQLVVGLQDYAQLAAGIEQLAAASPNPSLSPVPATPAP